MVSTVRSVFVEFSAVVEGWRLQSWSLVFGGLEAAVVQAAAVIRDCIGVYAVEGGSVDGALGDFACLDDLLDLLDLDKGSSTKLLRLSRSRCSCQLLPATLLLAYCSTSVR
jgi:hypothetical protein